MTKALVKKNKSKSALRNAEAEGYNHLSRLNIQHYFMEYFSQSGKYQIFNEQEEIPHFSIIKVKSTLSEED